MAANIDYATRFDLVAKLREATGVSSPKIIEALNNFDPSTGTLYCGDSKVYNKEAIEAARDVIKKQKERFEDKEGAESMAQAFEIAGAVMDIYLKSISNRLVSKKLVIK